MVAKLVDFSDIAKLVRLSQENKDLEFLDAAISMRAKYGFESFNPVLKAVFYANIGKPEKKTLNKWLHLMSPFKEYQLYSPFHSGCYEYSAQGMREVDKQENITGKKHILSNFCDIKKNNLKAIPHITHNVWMLSSTVQNIDTQVQTFNKNNAYQQPNYNVTSHWEHYVWLPTPQVVTVALQNRIIEDHYTVKYIAELADDEKGAFLVSAALTFVEFGYYALTSDFLRFLILNKYGGVYLDGDYKIYRNLDNLVDNFESIVGDQAYNNQCTAFIAMSSQHHIVQTALELMIRNINLTDAPEYVKYPCSKGARVLATDPVLSISLITNQDTLNNQTNLNFYPGIISDYNPRKLDPSPHFNSTTYQSYCASCPESFMETEIGIIGQHVSHGSWQGDKLEKLDYNI